MKNHWLSIAIAVTLWSAWGCSQAHEYYVVGFKLIHPWAEATAPGARSAPVYMRLEDIARSDRLISATTPFAMRVELVGAGADRSSVATERQEGTPLEAIDIHPGKDLDLSPGHAHLLLRELTEPLQWGRSYMMTLVFERAGEVHVIVSIGAH